MTAMNPPINPSEKEFAAFADGRAFAPLVFRAANDGVLAWAAFAAMEKRRPYAFLLESASAENGRYSFMGASPRRVYVFQNGQFADCDGGGKVLRKTACADPVAALQERMEPLACSPADERLPPFLGGAVGYLGYDCAHCFENIGEMKSDLLKIPDALWMQTDWLAIFDHHRHNVYAVKSCYREDLGRDGWRGCWRRGREQAKRLLARLSAAATPPLRLPDEKIRRGLSVRSNMSEERFCKTVESFQKHIRAGDIFQGVPSQRFSFALPAPPLDIYRCLRRMNPSPYMFYLKCGGFVAAGASPELMLDCRNGKIELRPIAGTRPRGDTPAEDARLEKELLGDEKEIAEHLMLVDLGRNDVGRVAAAGTVKTSRFCQIEKYSHVMHIVSAVEGRLRPGMSAFDGLRAAFPAGTLSGAPKVRAMQLINQHEDCKRHIYGGCAGYAGFDGGMTTCIAIRSFVAKDGQCHVQAGGGVVADSKPHAEYVESKNKAAAALRAAEIAGEESAAKAGGKES